MPRDMRTQAPVRLCCGQHGSPASLGSVSHQPAEQERDGVGEGPPAGRAPLAEGAHTRDHGCHCAKHRVASDQRNHARILGQNQHRPSQKRLRCNSDAHAGWAWLGCRGRPLVSP
eukprot:scaffold1969_cov130-Isochrysis_galbana.AAC.3